MKKVQGILFVFLISVFLFPSFSCVSAEKEANSKFSLYGGLNFNIHSANFKKLPGIPSCCPRYEEGSGTGWNFGIGYEYRLDDKFWLGGRLGLMDLSGTLTRDENVPIILNNALATGVFTHEVISKILNAGLEVLLSYNLFDNFFVSIGERVGLNIKKEYEQSEKITKPSNSGTFVDEFNVDTGKRVRNEFSGEIPDATAMQLFTFATVSYELPLNEKKTFLLAPELAYYLPMMNQAQNTDWKISPIKVSLAIKYAPKDEEPKTPREENIFKIDTIQLLSENLKQSKIVLGKEEFFNDTYETETEIVTSNVITRTDTLFTIKEYALSSKITAIGIDENGNEIANPTFKIEEYISNRLDPLLNYIFFDDNSSAIPSRYSLISKSQAAKFDITHLYSEPTLSIYYNMLNIIGERLVQNPKAEITLTGCNSDLGLEKGNTELSKKRAEAVRDYLVNVWSIESDRIKISSRNLPSKASTPKEEKDKIEENRRVEISSDNREILNPVFIEKIDRSSNPPVLRFKPEITSEAGVKEWTIEAYQMSNMKDKFVYNGNSSVTEYVDWKLEDFQKIIPKAPEPIIYSIDVTDNKNNKTEEVNKTLDIKVITLQSKKIEMLGDYQIEKFSLILFDFDKSTIDGLNKDIIKTIVQRIKPESEIEIIGFTDRTGNPEHNQKLSESRAATVKSSIKRDDAQAKGIGNNELLYDNNLPEGRFYCRTVVITVKTKVN